MSLLAQRSDSYAFCLSRLCCHGSCETWTLKADIKKKGSQGHTERQTKHPSCPGNYPWIWNISLVKAPFSLPSKGVVGCICGFSICRYTRCWCISQWICGFSSCRYSRCWCFSQWICGFGAAVVGVSVGSVVVSSVDAVVVSSAG